MEGRCSVRVMRPQAETFKQRKRAKGGLANPSGGENAFRKGCKDKSVLSYDSLTGLRRPCTVALGRHVEHLHLEINHVRVFVRGTLRNSDRDKFQKMAFWLSERSS